MRLADAGGLPLDYTDYATQLRVFAEETKRLANRKTLGNSFDSKSLLRAIEDFGEAAARIEKRRREDILDSEKSSKAGAAEDSRAVARLRRINDALIQTERAFLDDRGLRGRTWYKHQVYAPGFYTGYAALPFPDLRQAIEDGRVADAGEAANRIIEALKRATEVLQKGRE
jgi:N-acetylated-alpha-linked acidic dipeptidase